MSRWFYRYLRYSGTDLILFDATSGKQEGTRILFDPDFDDDLSDTLYRWVAALGAGGWELVGITSTNGTTHDWIFKAEGEEEG